MADVGIGDIFHIIHVSETLEPLDAFYDDVFGPRRGIMDGNYSAMEKRDASLIAIGNCIIEPMAPSKHVEGWDVMPVGRFWKKFGSHWHSLAWYCRETGTIWDRLEPRGVRMVTDGGNPLNGRPTGEQSETSHGSLFTHPKDTGTQLEFYPRVMPSDPRFAPGWDGNWWATYHPLGVRRLAYVTLVVRDMDRIVEMYVDGLGGRPLHESESALTGTRNVYVLVGADTIVELASPLSGDSLAARDLAAYGDMLHATAFRVESLPAAEKHLADKGIGIIGRDDHTILADPQKTFGAPFRFTTWDVPSDPRDLPPNRPQVAVPQEKEPHMAKTNISESMQAAIGGELSRMTSFPITDSDIRRWAVAIYYPEDPPRMFWDTDYAAQTRYGGIVAPEEFNPFAWMTADGPRKASVGHNPDLTEMTLGIGGPGLKFQLNGGSEVEYGVRMRPGDVITSVRSLAGYSEREGRLGLMLFTVSQDVWTNQNDEVVKTTKSTLIRY